MAYTLELPVFCTCDFRARSSIRISDGASYERNRKVNYVQRLIYTARNDRELFQQRINAINAINASVRYKYEGNEEQPIVMYTDEEATILNACREALDAMEVAAWRLRHGWEGDE